MKSKARLTLVIITLNEERNIARCIDSAKDIVDEIIVLDAFSSDKTEQICKERNVQFIQKKWEGYSKSKNHLNSLVETEYILSLDADEALSETIREEIRKEKEKGFEGTYYVNRLTNYLGKWIRYSGWFPDLKPRIFPKEGSYWSGEFVHETLVYPMCEAKQFVGVVEHYSYYSYEDHRQRADKYSVLTAQKFYAAGKKVSVLKPYLSALGRFVSMYFLKLGFLDGLKGFKIAQISALSNVVKYKTLLKLWKDGK